MDTQVSAQPFQVVLLAGGKGQKIFPLADHYPKPLLPVSNKPLIAYQLEHLERMGFVEVVVLMRHSKTLEKYLKNDYKGKMQIEAIEINEESTNNVEALKQVWSKIKRDFIVIPCDLITDINFDDILDQHIVTQATATLVFRENETKQKKDSGKETKDESSDYDVVVIEEETKRVLQIANNSDVEMDGLNIKKTILLRHPSSTISTQLFDCHIYVFSHQILDFLRRCKRKFFNIKEDLIPFLVQHQYNKKMDLAFFAEEENLEENEKLNPKIQSLSKIHEKKNQHVSVYAYVSKEAYCRRLNMINEYIQGNLDALLKTPNLPLCLFPTKNNESEVKEKKFNDTVIGEGTIIGEKCLISRSVIGKNCQIGSNVKITKSVIMNNVIIENDCVLQDSVICNKVLIKSKAKVKDDVVAQNETITGT